jgi:hypothetical protein
MAHTLSEAVQRTLVSHGLALGCLYLGVTAITGNKMELEFAFNRAWRRFPLATTVFKRVKGSMQRCDVLGILYDSPRTKPGQVTWETDGPWWYPDLGEAVTTDDLATHMRAVYGLDADHWKALARSLVDRLGDGRVRSG